MAVDDDRVCVRVGVLTYIVQSLHWYSPWLWLVYLHHYNPDRLPLGQHHRMRWALRIMG